MATGFGKTGACSRPQNVWRLCVWAKHALFACRIGAAADPAHSPDMESIRPTQPRAIPRLDVVVIGGGQAGLSAGYYLREAGLRPDRDFTILDHAPEAGGAWQFRWPSLTLSTVNGVHDLPGGFGLAESLGLENSPEIKAAHAVPQYFHQYEVRFGLPVHRPVSVRQVSLRGGRYLVETDRGRISARAVLNATGTWDAPYRPAITGAERFTGLQIHAQGYRDAAPFRGMEVVVVGAGISAIQILEEVSQVAHCYWATRSAPRYHEGPFLPEHGRAAVARVEARVRAGLPPGSLVSATDLPPSEVLERARSRGVLDPKPMFTEMTEEAVILPDGTAHRADAVIWSTGFGNALGHLAGLGLFNARGGITMTGRLATQVEGHPRLHLLGYGPSASTVGATRAGRAAVREVLADLRREG
ncbi:NAD(P)-binding domain-containing protein [Thioclava sp. GXIMD2076]|uniref:NAD(P)-binding domain-containing protein n=2 Tax=Thioclava sp. GXIMD2076 TaxID=3131931 RepID=UPI0030D50AE2